MDFTGFTSRQAAVRSRINPRLASAPQPAGRLARPAGLRQVDGSPIGTAGAKGRRCKQDPRCNPPRPPCSLSPMTVLPLPSGRLPPHAQRAPPRRQRPARTFPAPGRTGATCAPASSAADVPSQNIIRRRPSLIWDHVGAPARSFEPAWSPSRQTGHRLHLPSRAAAMNAPPAPGRPGTAWCPAPAS